MGVYAGVDLGASNVRAVIGDERGERLGIDRASTPDGPNGIAVTEAVLDVLRGACDEAGVSPAAVEAVGIGSIGPLDLAKGAVDGPANLPPAIQRIPLSGPISNLVGTDDVYLHNDTAAGVIGERYFSERNPDDMVYITISSGVGAGVCVDGNILAGWDGNAGEVGHMTLDPDGYMECGCGQDGHWEAYCSGNNIPRFAERVHEDEGIETTLDFEDGDVRGPDVFAAAAEDDPLATEVLDRVAHLNAMGVANVVHAFAPLVVYVGGAVALNNPERTLDPIREALPDMVMTNLPDVQLTTLGDDVVVMGALASALSGGTGERRRRP